MDETIKRWAEEILKVLETGIYLKQPIEPVVFLTDQLTQVKNHGARLERNRIIDEVIDTVETLKQY